MIPYDLPWWIWLILSVGLGWIASVMSDTDWGAGTGKHIANGARLIFVILQDEMDNPIGRPAGTNGLRNFFKYIRARAIVDGVHGIEPWISDGTESGTFLMGDINPGPSSSQPHNFIYWRGQVYFEAGDFEHGRELWVYDLGLQIRTYMPLVSHSTP